MKRVVRVAARIAVYTGSLLVAQLAFAEHFDHTEIYVINFQFTVMVLFEGTILYLDSRHA